MPTRRQTWYSKTYETILIEKEDGITWVTSIAPKSATR